MRVGRNGTFSRSLPSLWEFLGGRSAQKFADGMSNAVFFRDPRLDDLPDRTRGLRVGTLCVADLAVYWAQRLKAVNAALRGRLASALRSAGASAEIGRTLAGERRAAAERTLDGSNGRQGPREGHELAKGLEPLDRQHDSGCDRLRGQETAGKAGIFAIGRRGMPVVMLRLAAEVGVRTVAMILVARANFAREFAMTAMPASRMIVQRMDRGRGQQITGKRENNENPL
jgi:hypothetical protein